MVVQNYRIREKCNCGAISCISESCLSVSSNKRYIKHTRNLIHFAHNVACKLWLISNKLWLTKFLDLTQFTDPPDKCFCLNQKYPTMRY